MSTSEERPSVVSDDGVIRSTLSENTIRKEYNRRMYTVEKNMTKWRRIMGDYFQPTFDWAVDYIGVISKTGFDLTRNEGKVSLEATIQVLSEEFRHIFMGEYQGPELAKFYREKAAHGVAYLANKTVKKIIPVDDEDSDTISVKRALSPNEPKIDEARFKRAKPAEEEDVVLQSQPWTVQVWSAKTGTVIFRLHMQYLWRKEHPGIEDVDISSLKAECKAAADLNDDIRFVCVDYSGYNWPFYSDATLRTQFAEFIKDERSSTFYIYVEDREGDSRGGLLQSPWCWRAETFKSDYGSVNKEDEDVKENAQSLKDEYIY